MRAYHLSFVVDKPGQAFVFDDLPRSVADNGLIVGHDPSVVQGVGQDTGPFEILCITFFGVESLFIEEKGLVGAFGGLQSQIGTSEELGPSDLLGESDPYGSANPDFFVLVAVSLMLEKSRNQTGNVGDLPVEPDISRVHSGPGRSV